MQIACYYRFCLSHLFADLYSWTVEAKYVYYGDTEREREREFICQTNLR